MGLGTTRPVNYDLRNQNGANVWLPPNPTQGMVEIARPNVYEQDTIQQVPVGSIATVDQRKFAYSLAGGTLTGWSRLCIDASYIPSASGQTDVDGFEGNIYAAVAAGGQEIEIEDGTDRAVNYYQGGYFTAFNADGIRSTTIRIAASDVAASVNNVTLHLDDGLPWAVVEHDFCAAYRNPYNDITASVSNGFETFMGLSLIAVTSGKYFWLQIAGPAWIAQSAAATIPGYTVDKRDAFAHRDGTCIVGSTAGSLQRIGYALGKSISTTGDTYIMLQLG